MFFSLSYYVRGVTITIQYTNLENTCPFRKRQKRDNPKSGYRFTQLIDLTRFGP